jgi:hypothetical protein
MNKYTFRRLLLGVVIVPATAVAWFVIYAGLVGLGATATNTPQGVFGDGIFIGIVLTIWLMFYEKINALFDKVGL